ncbi:MAG: energy transducer TonB [Sphingomicrobium sp.]
MRIQAFMAAVAVVPSLASAATPLQLAPATPWVLDYATNSCRLIRHFGQGKDATVFALESEAPGALDMLVAGKPTVSSMYQVPAKFLPLQTKPMLGFPARSTDNGDPLVLWSWVTLLPDDAAAAEAKRLQDRVAHPEIRPPAVSLAEQAAKKAQRQAFATNTTAIEIDGRVGRPVILETGPLGEPIKAFDQCSRNSLRDWGVDPDLEDKIVRPVWAPKPWAWFNSSDYPKDMILRYEESVVKVRLLVDATGRVTKCTSISHFKEPAFNKITCDKFTERAHFEPAELADGTKVPSYYVNKIVFRLER